MPKRSVSHSASIPPEYVEQVTEQLNAIHKWGDEVVSAWLEGRDYAFEWIGDDYWVHLEVVTRNRSIEDEGGETLVTRANSQIYLALVSGKRYRSRHSKLALDAMRDALLRREVPSIIVRPPYAGYVDADRLNRWYEAAKVWHACSTEEYLARYMNIAYDLVNAFEALAPDAMYADGYYLAWANPRNGITTGSETIAVWASRKPAIALLSGRRYARWSHSRSLRDTVRIEFERRGIAFREVRSARPGYAMPKDLVQAWEANPLRPI
jgi:hypothetical protein